MPGNTPPFPQSRPTAARLKLGVLPAGSRSARRRVLGGAGSGIGGVGSGVVGVRNGWVRKAWSMYWISSVTMGVAWVVAFEISLRLASIVL